MPDSTAPLVAREPVRVFVLVAAGIAALGVFFMAWGSGTDWRIAIGMALGAGGTPAVGAEVGRSKAYSPATVDQLVDAEAVIRGLEARG